MKQRLLATLAIAALAVAAVVLWYRNDPRTREVRRVQSRLQELATSVSFSEKDPPFVRLGYAGKVEAFFADPVEFEVTLGARGAQGPMPRTQLREGAMGLRGTATGLSVQFMDIAVALDEDARQATAHLTSKIFFTGDSDYFVQEFRIRLKVLEGRWLVYRVETVKTMEQ